MSLSQYSGKPLSEVPYERILIGMKVIKDGVNEGTVIEKFDKEGDDEDNIIYIRWNLTVKTHCWHYLHTNVKVK